MLQDAVLRNFEVIGGAAKRLDDTYRAAYPEIPWRALAGLRDVLIHQYEGVDLEGGPSSKVSCLGSKGPWPPSCRPWSSSSVSWQMNMSRIKTHEEVGYGG